ncbi:hypothetical protein J2S17_001164 [Cytobacillus purgationiresistens]|uniref:Uncharacterized protein n=1 Tax=Cytobacillus purgationiresistens TaxID=863449 RepID=A0ABU0ADG4_9BACI|nr:hypothetical protein [Cytobacillus purgationiresistens]
MEASLNWKSPTNVGLFFRVSYSGIAEFLLLK